jgi:hypothetical protein
MPGAFFRSPFCGSKAGATFRLAMISIGSGLESLASQRRRNNWLTVEMKNGARQIIGRTAKPPHRGVSGAGGWRAVSRPKSELQYYTVSCGNSGVLTVGSTCDGDRERAEVANHIYMQRLGRLHMHQCLVAAFALACARKKRIISRLASGPRASVYEPLALPPDQAWPAPCRTHCSRTSPPASSSWTVRV